jgi:hypothetical protein
MVENVDVSDSADAIGWRLTNISYGEIRGKSSALSEVIERDRLNQNVSPQLSFGGIFRASYEPVSGAPQSPSRNTQNASREAQNDGPNGDDALRINPFEAATPNNEPHSFQSLGLVQ